MAFKEKIISFLEKKSREEYEAALSELQLRLKARKELIQQQTQNTIATWHSREFSKNSKEHVFLIKRGNMLLLIYSFWIYEEKGYDHTEIEYVVDLTGSKLIPISFRGTENGHILHNIVPSSDFEYTDPIDKLDKKTAILKKITCLI